MEKEAFYSEIAQVLQMDRAEINDDVALNETTWDSMAQVSALLVLDQFGSKQVTPNDLAKCKSVGDLVRLAEAK